jgi:hypothetical protein
VGAGAGFGSRGTTRNHCTSNKAAGRTRHGPGAIGLVASGGEQTNCLRVLNASSHLLHVVWLVEGLLFAGIRVLASVEQLDYVSEELAKASDGPYLGAERRVLKHDRRVAELLNQVLATLDGWRAGLV